MKPTTTFFFGLFVTAVGAWNLFAQDPPTDSDASATITCTRPKHKQDVPQTLEVHIRVKGPNGKTLRDTGNLPVLVEIPQGVTAKQKATLIREGLERNLSSWKEVTFTNGTQQAPSSVISIDAKSGVAGKDVRVIKPQIKNDKTNESTKVAHSDSTLRPVGEEYLYTVNPDLAPFFPPGQVPFGAVFYLSGSPSGFHPEGGGKSAFVGFGFDGITARATIEAGDSLLTVATKLASEFVAQGVTCTIFQGGAILACESVTGDQITEYGSVGMDQGIAVGADLLKF